MVVVQQVIKACQEHKDNERQQQKGETQQTTILISFKILWENVIDFSLYSRKHNLAPKMFPWNFLLAQFLLFYLLAYALQLLIVTELREDQADQPANAEPQKEATPPRPPEKIIGEGGENGDIIPGKSVVFATLEVCLCVLVRHLPSLNPAIPTSGLAVISIKVNRAKISDTVNRLISTADLPNLCSPKGRDHSLHMLQ